MVRVLVVEDEANIREMIALNLRLAGMEAVEAESAEAALPLLEQKPGCDAAILDVMLPGMNGFSLCESIRRTDQKIGIIILSAKGQEQDKIRGLSIGADDYMTKPFSVSELLARVEAQLRRYKQFSGGGGSAVLTHGDLTLDREGVTVTAAGKPVTVTAREFDILTLLMEHPKKVFTREQLYEQVWGGEYMGDDNTVNVHISNLRAKLAKASPAEYIKTVWGIGFKMSDL